uniref:non-specific serine/threonine protein kinase n=1 Tax=Castor canadensis TaxID=51338 RepID=A0A8B7WEQ8_CASCN|nr:serine/threonine-protein kinase TAO3-like [Castor canadensis]
MPILIIVVCNKPWDGNIGNLMTRIHSDPGEGTEDREMDSLGSNHSIPSMSVSTSSQSSSVNSMQEVLDESSSDLVMMHEEESTMNSSSSVVHKKGHVFIRDEAGHGDPRPEPRPTQSVQSQALHYRNRERFATIKSASLPSQSSSLWRIKLPPCQAASGYGQSPEEPL